MSLFEEYLTLGQWLAESQRLAIYKYLLISRKDKYKNDGEVLVLRKTLNTFIANGEIIYSITSNVVEYRSRKIGEVDWNDEIRKVKLSSFKFLLRKRLAKFFAQAELDSIRNYPLAGVSPIEDRSFTMNVYPYYDLNYYSNGCGKAKGLLKRLQSKDDELLEKLLAS